MTRPKDFIFNSDYLALAQSQKDSFNHTFEQRTMNPYSSANIGFNHNTTFEPGAIDRFYISTDNTNWSASSTRKVLFENDPALYADISISRIYFGTNSNRLRVRVVYNNLTNNSYTFPEITLYVRLDSFKPPNVL